MARTATRKVSDPKRTSAPSRRPPGASPPAFVQPQLCQLRETAPSGPNWVHEIKLDGYRIAARIDRGDFQLLTRAGNDWTEKYPSAIEALSKVRAKSAYIDGELCGIDEKGLPNFNLTQLASDGARGITLVYFVFDLLFLDGKDVSALPLSDRKALLEPLVADIPGFQFSEHHKGDGETIRKHACQLGMEGVVSKRIDQPYAPGNRGLWVKSKCLQRQEFVIVGWTDPEGTRPYLGALLLGYYTGDGRLMYAGRVGTGMPDKVLKSLFEKLQPLTVKSMPLAAKPPRKTRSPLVLSRLHWVKPELVAEVTFLTWAEDGLIRHSVYQGLREDKPAHEVRRE